MAKGTGDYKEGLGSNLERVNSRPKNSVASTARRTRAGTPVEKAQVCLSSSL